MRIKASIALLFLAISGSAIAHSAAPLKGAIALKVPIDNLTVFPKSLAAYSQTPASSKSWQNARLVRTLPIMDSSPVLSPTSPILATYRRGEQTRTEGDKTISSQTNENIITLTNINTGEEIRRITYDSPSELKSLMFSPDGRLLASHTYNPFRGTLTIRLWDVSTGKELQTLRRLVKPKRVEGTGIDTSGNSAIAFSPDGQSLLSTAGGNSTIYVWDLAAKQASTTKEIDKVTPALARPKNQQKSPANTNQIEQSVLQDRRQFSDYEVADYRIVKDALEAGKNLEQIKTLLRQQSKLVQHWRKTEPTAAYQTKTDFYVDLITQLQTQNYVFEKATAVLEELGTDTNEGKRKFTAEGFVVEKSGNDFLIASDNGQRVITQIKDGNFTPNFYPSFQDLIQFKAIVNILLNQGNLRFALTGHKDEITAFAVSPNSQLLASDSLDKTIKIWNFKTGKLIYTLKGNSARNSNLVISPDNRLLASVNTDYDNLEKNQIQLWDLKTGKLARTIPVQRIVSFIRFSSDGKKIINTANSPFSSTQFQIRDANTGKLIAPSQEFGDPKNSTLNIAISPDEKTYAIAGQERTFHVRDLMTGGTIATFGWEELWVDYTADGKSLVTSGREGIKVWE